MRHTTFLPILTALFLLPACSGGEKGEQHSAWLCADRPEVTLYKIDAESKSVYPTGTVPRGRKADVWDAQEVKIAGQRYERLARVSEVSLKKMEKALPDSVRKACSEGIYALRSNLSTDSLALVLEKRIHIRTATSILSDTLTSQIASLAEKGDSLKVTGYDFLRPDGSVKRYKVSYRVNAKRDSTGAYIGKPQWKDGWIRSKYTVFTHEQAIPRYNQTEYDRIHGAVRNPFGGGKAIGCDFYPVEKPVLGKMPKACYSLYLNFSPAVIGNIESYIALAKKTRINTFVIDIKDNECPGYGSEAMKTYSPTNYAHSTKNGAALYEKALRRLHEEGFWVVGRITCFKDTYFVKDHPESAITEIATGEPVYHNKSYWPSAFDRKVWQFNVELAKESVARFGFDEINFDYVRFPDRMMKIADKIDYHNLYRESKVQAIQRFVQYACDEIHEVGAYVSIDVFGECANEGYTTAYGQYWPALSNVADVMCGMPYPDHFTDGYYGISKPWNHPYELLYQWGKRIKAKQKTIPTPARVRTWVQVWKVMKHVDPNGIDYTAAAVEKEIRGLYSAGLRDGYCTWLSSSNIKRYELIQDAFKIDYYNEYSPSGEWLAAPADSSAAPKDSLASKF